MPVLAKFREYHVWLKGGESGVVRDKTRSLLNIAHARLRIAKQFEDVRIRDVSPLLVRGYSVGVRLLLSYSAAETMGKAIGPHVAEWKIRNDDILPALRRLGSHLRDWDYVLEEPLRKRIDGFVRGDCDNVRVMATALRHLMAHGHFAPAGELSLNKASTLAVEKLCDNLLHATEKRFVAWFEKVSGTSPARLRQ
jgi:hypothetical protein